MHASRRRQYFGVAGVTTGEEVSRIVGFLDVLDLPEHVRFMNGPLVSYKTLNGHEPSNPKRYPVITSLPGLLVTDPRVFNIIHYNSKEPNLFAQLCQLMRISPWIHGIQLNIANPSLEKLARFRKAYPETLIVLQIGSGVFESCHHNVVELIQYVRRYEDVVDYALLDLSGGKGVPFDTSIADRFVHGVAIERIPVMVGVTGGLNADRVLSLSDLLARDRSLCWDAESGLRTDGDVLDLDKCFAFCAASAAILKW